MELVLEKILEVFDSRGNETYADEKVTQLQHALQCAEFAENEGCTETLIAAALLHDIGHIVGEDDLPASCSDNLHDDHEDKGYQFLYVHFGDAVAEPVRLHVAAKRYLCTTDPSYVDQLSPTSYKSYQDQGGTMSIDELREFESNEFFESAIRLRKWDDAAKDPENTDLCIRQFIPACQVVLDERKTSNRK